MLKESLRQRCIYEVTNRGKPESEYDPTAYFQYVINYYDECVFAFAGF